jgi:hypothetical protein
LLFSVYGIPNAFPAMKNRFGDEYPAAIERHGVRMPLVSESRWLRHFAAEGQKVTFVLSRFMDGSAAITFEELTREWPAWNRKERNHFCLACSYLRGQPDFPDMLRFIMQHGGPDDWSGVACNVASCLPPDEAFRLLAHALHNTGLSRGCNISQGISRINHPGAAPLLREYLGALWSSPSLWDNHEFVNWTAYSATCTIEHLISLGDAPKDFTEHVRRLAQHICVRNRESCRPRLGKFFSWLNDQPALPLLPPFSTA